MSEILGQVKAEFTRAKDRLVSTLNATPEDKLTWSPAPTARTPLQLVACAAIGNEGMLNTFSGKPFPYSNMQEMDEASRAKEKSIKSRKEALEMFENSCSKYLTWLDTLSTSQLNSMVKMPMGDMPLSVAVTFPSGHIHCRACQLDYVQTAYGDLDWHMDPKA